MNDIADPTNAICVKAMSYPNVTQSMSCNQSSFKSKSGKSKFLFIGPGVRGQGFKAMFKLDGSFAQAAKWPKRNLIVFKSVRKVGGLQHDLLPKIPCQLLSGKSGFKNLTN